MSRHVHQGRQRLHQATGVRWYCTSLLCWLMLAGASGCGNAWKPCTVEGVATFNSNPIPKGAIRFVTEDGTPGNGGLGPITDGKFAIRTKGMAAGKYVVVISGFEETGRKFKADSNGPELNEERQYLPAKYNSSSTLTVVLNAGANTEEFHLTP